MKIVIQLAFFAMLLSCKTQRKIPEKKIDDNPIIYIIQTNVEELLKKELPKHHGNVYFQLGGNCDIYTIYIGSDFENNPTSYVTRSNRKLFIDNKFYPLIFELDELFGSIDSADSIKIRSSREKYITYARRFIVNEGFYVKFKRDGEIISSGYGLAEPMNKK